MRNWHPIWFMRYVVEEFPEIVHDYLSIAIFTLAMLGEVFIYLVQLINITIYNSIMLLLNKKK